MLIQPSTIFLEQCLFGEKKEKKHFGLNFPKTTFCIYSLNYLASVKRGGAGSCAYLRRNYSNFIAGHGLPSCWPSWGSKAAELLLS